MRPVSQPVAPIEEMPLISNGLLFRLTAVVALLAITAVGISVGGRWLGQRISLGGNTDDTKPYTVTIGDDTLRLPANTIRFPSERLDGAAERVDLYFAWPQMQGYSQLNKARFNDASQGNSLIFLQIAQSTMSRDMSGRLEPVYSHLMEGAPFAGPYGLTEHRLRADAGYNGEVLLTAPRPGKSDYVVRCALPATPDKATSGDCQRDIRVGKDLSVLYRFSSRLLGDWDHIDAAIETSLGASLVRQPDAAAGSTAEAD